MKKYGASIAFWLLFLAGIFVLVYPSVSNDWNRVHQTRAIKDYKAVSSSMTNEELTESMQEAERYNEQLRHIDFPFACSEKVPGYEEILNVSGTGIMGYIRIPKIGVELPIYHTADSEILNAAAGHLQGSSFPTGGKGTHCVLSGHRGLPSAKLFSDLDKLEIGDRFQLSVLNRELAYQVDQILIVSPDRVSELCIKDGKDYCTLVTCTPYGINSHRMLVRGVRAASEDENPVCVLTEGEQINPAKVAAFLSAPFVLLPLVKDPRHGKRKRSEKIRAVGIYTGN